MTVFQRWNTMSAAQRLIVTAAVGIAVLFVWAAFAQVDQITRGIGKVIPSSKAQLVQPAEP
jgi:adhesin transport system membrane fusion protein